MRLNKMNKVEKKFYSFCNRYYFLGICGISFTIVITFCKLVLEDSNLNIFMKSFISIAFLVGIISFYGKHMIEEYFDINQEVKD